MKCGICRKDYSPEKLYKCTKVSVESGNVVYVNACSVCISSSDIPDKYKPYPYARAVKKEFKNVDEEIRDQREIHKEIFALS